MIERVLPVLEQAGRDTMRMPDPGRKRRKSLDSLLADTPELAVVIDSFEQRGQRSTDRSEADSYYSGKKKQHTLKSQVAVNEDTGEIVDTSLSVPGPTADMNLLQQSGLMQHLPSGVGGLGDLAYVGIDQLHPDGLGAAPRRKPRGKPRPPKMCFTTPPFLVAGLLLKTRSVAFAVINRCLSLTVNIAHTMPLVFAPFLGWLIARSALVYPVNPVWGRVHLPLIPISHVI